MRPPDSVLGLPGAVSGESCRSAITEAGGVAEARSRGDDTHSAYLSRCASGADSEVLAARRAVASALSRASEEALNASRARGGMVPAAAGNQGASPATSRRRPLVQREEEEDFQPSVRAASGSRQGGSGGRAGVARRAARNVSYTALAGMETDDQQAFQRPLKRLTQADLHMTNLDIAVADSWDHSRSRDAASDAAAGESDIRGSLQQWAALQQQAAAAAEERLPSSSQGTRGSAERGTTGASISTDQLHEALKGFVQSIKAGASPSVVSVPSMARNRSFAASH